MDNHLQIEEIRKYDEYLSEEIGAPVPLETAAMVWVLKYAKTWRLKHPQSIGDWGFRIAD